MQIFHWEVKKGQGMKLTTHLQLVLWLRTCGAIPLLAPYAFTVYKGTDSPPTYLIIKT